MTTPEELSHAWLGFYLPKKPSVPPIWNLPHQIILRENRSILLTIIEGSMRYAGTRELSLKSLPKPMQRYLRSAIPLYEESLSLYETLCMLHDSEIDFIVDLFPSYENYEMVCPGPIGPILSPTKLRERLYLLSLIGTSEDLVNSGRAWDYFT